MKMEPPKIIRTGGEGKDNSGQAILLADQVEVPLRPSPTSHVQEHVPELSGSVATLDSDVSSQASEASDFSSRPPLEAKDSSQHAQLPPQDEKSSGHAVTPPPHPPNSCLNPSSESESPRQSRTQNGPSLIERVARLVSPVRDLSPFRPVSPNVEDTSRHGIIFHHRSRSRAQKETQKLPTICPWKYEDHKHRLLMDWLDRKPKDGVGK